MRSSHKLWLTALALPLAACASGTVGPTETLGGGAPSGPSYSDDSGGIPTLPPLADSGTPPSGKSSYDSGSGSGKSGKSGYSDDDGGSYSSYDSGSYEEDAYDSYDSGGSGTAPTTCTEADGKIGCCDGNVLYYCSSSLTSKKCSGSDVCGWDKSSSYYGCVAAPGGADPSGTYPLACK